MLAHDIRIRVDPPTADSRTMLAVRWQGCALYDTNSGGGGGGGGGSSNNNGHGLAAAPGPYCWEIRRVAEAGAARQGTVWASGASGVGSSGGRGGGGGGGGGLGAALAAQAVRGSASADALMSAEEVPAGVGRAGLNDDADANHHLHQHDMRWADGDRMQLWVGASSSSPSPSSRGGAVFCVQNVEVVALDGDSGDSGGGSNAALTFASTDPFSLAI